MLGGKLSCTTPMDGSFWSRAQPGTPPFVSPGASVKTGETVGLVEVMKTFSPIRAPADGVWVEAPLTDGDGIQTGDVVGWLRPA